MTIAIRLSCAEDVPAMTAIYAPYVSDTVISFEAIPPTEHEMMGRMLKTIPRFSWLVADADGDVVGYAYAGQHRERAAYQWATDVSVYLHKDWRGRGIGRALYTALFAILRAQGYYNVYAGITLPNPASVALHEAMGMTPVGVYRHVGYKAGAWHDVGWWEGALQPRVAEPAPPLTMSALLDTPTLDSCLHAGESLLRTPQARP
jgi:phosphinothricin acetyltransferase